MAQRPKDADANRKLKANGEETLRGREGEGAPLMDPPKEEVQMHALHDLASPNLYPRDNAITQRSVSQRTWHTSVDHLGIAKDGPIYCVFRRVVGQPEMLPTPPTRREA